MHISYFNAPALCAPSFFSLHRLAAAASAMRRLRVRRVPPGTLELLLNLTNRHVHAQLVDRAAGRVFLGVHTTEQVSAQHADACDAEHPLTDFAHRACEHLGNP